ncbi:uncharacterized protein F5891DRAFT_965124 [Suillus fuscotomentosus]|uniref:Uncharacterized protein n=1 Tax=Suillus fuscotomentosus TaxID=1912939 RepID=A0AAD4DQF5_9AGAM|nr:uncharacterized protein F5891DRAFT_965124 [Suillus fuscotomentosus]KAG1889770.1 hypothetical protein F5891DRAFT_965124 [Suillus fuscotomentosus]
MPKRYDNFVPGDEVPDVPQPEDVMSEEGDHTGDVLISFETEPDTWGLYRVYPTRPTLFPWTGTTLNTLCDSLMLQTGENPNNTSSWIHTGPPLPFYVTPKNLYSAFSSPTAGLLMCWQYSTANLISNAALQRLTTFLNNDAYDRRDISIFNPTREKRLVTQYLEDHSNPFSARNGWKESSVYIHLPKE